MQTENLYKKELLLANTLLMVQLHTHSTRGFLRHGVLLYIEGKEHGSLIYYILQQIVTINKRGF